MTIEDLVNDYEKKLNEIYARANTKSKKKRIINELFNFSRLCFEYFGIEKTFEWENDIDMILLSDSYQLPFVQNITKNGEIYKEIFSKTLNTILTSDYSVYDYNYQSYMRITGKELEELIFEFLNSYDSTLVENFEHKLTNNELFYTYMEGFNGATYPMLNLNKSLIFYTTNIQDYYSIDTAATIVHELGHDYEMKKLSTVGKTNYYEATYGKPYYEIMSRFLEYAFINYLKENNMYKDDTNKILHTHIYDLLFRSYNISLLYKMKEVKIDESDKVKIEEKPVIEYAKELQGKMNSYVFPAENGDTINCRHSFIYGIGDIFSINLYESYKGDPNNFKKEIVNAILSSLYHDDISPFERVGITKDNLEEATALKKLLKNIK